MNIEHNPNRKGDFAEYYAVTWLWDNGFEVFHNCGCTGAVDLIAMSPSGTITLIDVKTLKIDHRRDKLDYKSHLTPLQKELGVVVLAFNPDTRKCYFVGHTHETNGSGHRDKQHTQYNLVCSDSGC